MSTLLDRLGRASARNHRLVIGAWVLAAVAVVVLATGLDGTTSDNFRIPGAQSQEALDVLEQRFPPKPGQCHCGLQATAGRASCRAGLRSPKRHRTQAIPDVSRRTGSPNRTGRSGQP